MTEERWEELKNKATEDEYLQNIISTEQFKNNLVEARCPLCEGEGLIFERDEQGDPYKIACFSCGYGVSGEDGGNIMAGWEHGSAFIMRHHDFTFQLATSLSLNRIACALEAIALCIDPDTDVLRRGSPPGE